MKEHKGELWGMGNLFRESLHKVTAQEIFSNERPDVHYHMRQMDRQQYGRLLLLVWKAGNRHVLSGLAHHSSGQRCLKVGVPS